MHAVDREPTFATLIIFHRVDVSLNECSLQVLAAPPGIHRGDAEARQGLPKADAGKAIA